MKFIHTSDLHLGKKIANYSLAEDQAHMMSLLYDAAIAHDVDAVVIAGDVFDTVAPPDYATRLWDEFLTRMSLTKIPVLVVSGNHDSGARLGCGSRLFSQAGIHIAGELAHHLEPITIAGVNFWLIPFVRPSDVRAWASQQKDENIQISSYEEALDYVIASIRLHPLFAHAPNVCVAHQFITAGSMKPQLSESERGGFGPSVGTLDNIDAAVFDDFAYVALGHIHAPQSIGRSTIRYSGTPLKYSSSEAHQNKSFMLVSMSEDGKAQYKPVPVTALHDFRIVTGSLDELQCIAAAESAKQREDFVQVMVVEDNPVDVVERIKYLWPHYAGISVQSHNGPAIALSAAPSQEKLENSSLKELFSDFFENQLGKPLSADEDTLVSQALTHSSEGLV
ncbi:exonuclease SbcCD subunit D [Atopobium fossor]|uniref:exonuclease SbcCD subunit D n=1 Tax=Atopobium fossor TaxID=39487 RepID=UPI000417D6C3|nr:exonuclease SbcCD subunit D [Atopobium fossor]